MIKVRETQKSYVLGNAPFLYGDSTLASVWSLSVGQLISWVDVLLEGEK